MQNCSVFHICSITISQKTGVRVFPSSYNMSWCDINIPFSYDSHLHINRLLIPVRIDFLWNIFITGEWLQLILKSKYEIDGQSVLKARRARQYNVHGKLVVKPCAFIEFQRVRICDKSLPLSSILLHFNNYEHGT